MSTHKSKKSIACATVGAAAILASASAFAAPANVTHSKQLAHRNASAHKRHTPADSFLVYKVYSIDELIAQVQENPRIKKIYAHHFHVPQSRVIEYMRANLVESYVPETRVYTCYCVRENGLIYPVKQTFVKGTKVFALRNGEPVLKWVCGNPLSKFLPAVETHTVVKEMPIIKMAPSTEIIAPTDQVQVIVPTETEVVTTKSSSDFDVLIPPAIVGAAAPAAASFILAPAAAAGASAWSLAALPVAFAAIASSNHSSSNGGNTSDIPIPVPEVNTMASSAIVMAAGAIFLGLRRRALRRS